MDSFLFILLGVLVAGALAVIICRKKSLLFLLYPIVIGILICITILSDEAYNPIQMNGCELKHDVGYADNTWLYIDESNNNGYGGAWARMNKYALNKGTYTVHARYGTNVEGNMITVVDDGEYIVLHNLAVDESETEVSFTLEKDSQEIVIQFNYIGAGSLFAYDIELSTEDGFYNDCGYYVFLLAFAGVAGTAWYLLCVRKKKKQESGEQCSEESGNALIYSEGKRITSGGASIMLILLGIAILSFVPYLNGSLPWGDDLCYHLARIEGIKDGLMDGQLPVLIYPEALKGYGYTNAMYPNLFLYIPAIIRMFGVSIAASYKTLIFLSCIATSFITYYSVKSISGNTKAALVAAALYTLCPYRFTNLYARGALGEALALTFLPLLFAGLYQILCKDKKKWYVLALAMTGLVECHVLSMMLGAILCVIAGLVYLPCIIKERRFLAILKAAGLFLALNAAFLVPFLRMYQSGGLWMDMLGISKYGEYSLEATTLFGTLVSDGYRTLALGLPICLCACVGIFYYVKKGIVHRKLDEKQDGFVLLMLIAALVCILLLLGQFRAFKFRELGFMEWFFDTVQFPWRMLGMASALLCFVGPICLFKDENLSKIACVFGIGLVLITMLATTKYQDDDFSYKAYDSTYTKGHESKVVGIPKGERTIVYPYEWRQEGIFDEVIVAGAIRATDSSQLYVEHYEREGTTTVLTYITPDEGMEIELPVIYYPGYELVNEHGERVAVYMGNNHLVAFRAQADGLEHTVTLSFHAGLMNTLAFIVTLVFSIGGLCYAVANKYGVLVLLKQRFAKQTQEEESH